MRALVRRARWVAAVVTAAAIVGPLAAPASAQSASPSASSTGTSIAAGFTAFQAAVATATAAAEASLQASDPGAAAGAADYVRQLAQLDLETDLLASDPQHPQLFRDPDPFPVAGLDPPNRSGIYNPDNLNYIAVISDQGHYVISGRRGNSDDLSFQTITGFPGAGSVGTPTGLLPLTSLRVNADHTYSVDVGRTPGAANWLPTVAGTSLIAIRETFDNWSDAVPDTLSIQRVDPAPPSSISLPRALAAATRDVAQQNAFWLGFWGTLLRGLPADVMSKAAPTKGGLPDQVSSLSRYVLAPGQALVVTVAPSDAAFQGFEATDVWGQTLPYGVHQSSLNATQAQLGSDGLYHFVVSATDPGVANWIDTEGRGEGFLFLRWQGLVGPLPPNGSPTGRVVALSDVRSVLPPGTPTITPTQRVQSLLARLAGVDRREAFSSNDAEAALAPALQQLEAAVGQSAFATLYPSNPTPG